MLQIRLKGVLKRPEKDTKSNKDLMNFHMHFTNHEIHAKLDSKQNWDEFTM